MCYLHLLDVTAANSLAITTTASSMGTTKRSNYCQTCSSHPRPPECPRSLTTVSVEAATKFLPMSLAAVKASNVTKTPMSIVSSLGFSPFFRRMCSN